MDNRQILLALFLDLSKALDNLDHDILLDKLYNYGIRGVLLEWFKSYLSNRKQYVNFGKSNSEFKTIGCGVPQGSILGPLLFLVYMNDITNASKTLQYILFADDTSLFMSDVNLERLVTNFNIELDRISQWLCTNKLILNVKKTNYMIFTNRNINTDQVKVKINDELINCCDSLKFLGISIDSKLTWHAHIDSICNRLSKGVGVLNNLQHFPSHILLMIYNAVILPHLNYCNIAWGNSNNYRMLRLHKLQKTSY